MVNIAKHIRIFNTEPSDDLVDKRTAAIAKLTAVLGKKARLPEILELANNVAAGVIDPNKLSTALATEVEAAIKERSTAFDRDGNELEVLICLLLAMCQRLENHEADATSQSSNESRAAAVWSALSFQPSRSEPKLEALRDELMAKARALVLASGENGRRRLEVPDFSIEDGDESEEEGDEESEEGDIAQFKEDFMAGTEATIVALRTNADLDREELDLLWWALGDWSDLLDKRLSTLPAPLADPNQAGRNAVHLYFYDEYGRAAEIAEDVTVSFSLPAGDIGPIVREPFRAGPSHFQVDGEELVTGGRWVIELTATVSRFEEATAEVEVLVGD